MNVQDVVIRDLNGMDVTVKVKFSAGFNIRAWIARRLIQFAAFVLGANYMEAEVA